MAAASRELRAFDKRSRLRRRALTSRFDSAQLDALVDEARGHYEALLPEMSRIPGGVMNGALRGTYEYLAYAKALRGHGMTVEEMGEFFERSYLELVARYPRWLLRGVLRLVRPLLVRRLRREARESGEQPLEGGWRFEFVEPEPGAKGFGMNVESCAVCTLYARHEQMDVLPYVCALDDTMSDVMGMGLRRTGTRAMGAECCDFRYFNDEPKALRSIRTFPVVE